MGLKRFLSSKLFFANLALAVVLGVVVLIAAVSLLKVYTRHGEAFNTPDFTSMGLEEIVKTSQLYDVRVFVEDSVYKEGAVPGEVLFQYPNAGHLIKADRKIFVTLAASTPDDILFPELTDISLREAKVILERSGLRVGKVSYRYSQYENLVLDYRVGDKLMKQGDRVLMGTPIDLTVGKTSGTELATTPNLIGLSVKSALSIIEANMMNRGVVLFSGESKDDVDSIDAVVFKQNPEAGESIIVGGIIDIWLQNELDN